MRLQMPKLLSNLKINRMDLKNIIVMAPMCIGSCDENDLC